MNFSYYADLFGERGVDRAAMFLAMLGVVVLATTLALLETPSVPAGPTPGPAD